MESRKSISDSRFIFIKVKGKNEIEKLNTTERKKMPVISVIITVYNAEKYLRTAIDSVLNQSYSFFELILIDDASTDTSLDICGNYADKDERIHVLKNESKIHGPGMARNIGLDYAKGEFLYLY